MKLIRTFRVVADEADSKHKKAKLVGCEPLENPGTSERLVDHKNYRGFAYEENHLEEWIARESSAIFGDMSVLILASQNYAHLRLKIDLLFVDADANLYPVELKVVPVVRNGGVVPYDLYARQMKLYVDFLAGLTQLSELENHYERFYSGFHCRPSTLANDFAAAFGRQLPDEVLKPIREVYVAQSYDAFALEYFKTKSEADRRNIRLIEYRFFPQHSYVEFWNAYETPMEAR